LRVPAAQRQTMTPAGGHKGRPLRRENPFSRRLCVRVLATPFPKTSQKSRGERSAKRRVVQRPHRRVRRPLRIFSPLQRKYGGGSPLGAPLRRLPRKSMPWLSPGRVSWDVGLTGVTRRALSQSSEAPRRPVIMPAEAMPRPPGSGVTSPPAGTALAPSIGCRRPTPLDERVFFSYPYR
jgi:hypothetical protein